MESWQQKADAYLKVADQFALGVLPTEQSNPATRHLSDWAERDLPKAIRTLRELDLLALAVVESKWSEIEKMAQAAHACWRGGGRVFLAGCGATGRLSLSLESMWRSLHPGSDAVVSFIAGGDVALVRTVQGFEDRPDFGEKQLRELGFSAHDLLIASTEGGETPFVIGAAQAAAEISKHRPWFVFCNPRDLLIHHVERSRLVLTHPKIQSLELFVGPMALSGSTRLQASTVLQLAIGLALLVNRAHWAELVDSLVHSWMSVDIQCLAAFVEAESEISTRGDTVLYYAQDLPITVFTDTTERAPTFNLPPFGGVSEKLERHSLSYVILPQARNAREAWDLLLGRTPRALNWNENAATSDAVLMDFDFSQEAKAFRQRLTPMAQMVHFTISCPKETLLRWEMTDLVGTFNASRFELARHLFLKMIMNAHSTLVMGRLGRYRQNIMTWVYPSNGKLIDRAIRYAQEFLRADGRDVDDRTVALKLFEELESLHADESVVLKVHAALAPKSPMKR